jgi:hypothetical protein
MRGRSVLLRSVQGDRRCHEYCEVDYAHAGDYRHHHGKMLQAGAGLCLILTRAALDERLGDLARRAIGLGVPTYLIDDERSIPRSLRLDGVPSA